MIVLILQPWYAGPRHSMASSALPSRTFETHHYEHHHELQQVTIRKGSVTTLQDCVQLTAYAFVYWTLKKGFSNYWLREDVVSKGHARFFGTARTKQSFQWSVDRIKCRASLICLPQGIMCVESFTSWVPDDCPQLEGGLSMECIETRDGLSFFRYTFSNYYQELQRRSKECSALHDPNTIVMMVNRHPYHIDSLLTLAEMYRHMGESQVSAELLEKALYALECAWHPSFNITTGRCRLDFAWDPNKPLFVQAHATLG